MSNIFESFQKTLLFLCLVSVGIFAGMGSSLPHAPLNGNDERYYEKYIQTFHDEGFEGIRGIIATFPGEPETEAPPTPLRILFIFLGSVTCYFSTECGAENLAVISFVSAVGLVVVSFILFSKFFPITTSFAAALLLTFSPLLIFLSTRALQDVFFALIVLLSFLFYHHCWTRDKPLDLFFFGVLLFAGFLTKETMIFYYVCFLAAGGYYFLQTKNATPLRKFLPPMILAPAAYFLVVSWIAGGVSEFFSYYFLWADRVSNVPYVLEYQTGPWFRYLVDFLLLSPLTFILAIFGLVVPLSTKEKISGRKITATYFLSGLAAFSFFSVYNLRMVLFLDVFLRMLAVLGIIGISGNIRQDRLRYLFFFFAVLCIFWVELFQFYKLFVGAEVYDPITKVLMSGNGL